MLLKGLTMESRWIEDFLSVARTGSFSLSAKERHITQSAFSRRIKSLEQWLGVALIDRSSYPTRLTEAGERFLETAQQVTASLVNTRQELRHAAHSDRRILRIAIQHSLASGFLARWLATLPLERDDLLTQVRADNLHDCVRDLEEGGVDLLVCYTHPGLPMQLNTERFPSLTLSRDVLIPVSKPGPDGRPLHGLQSGSSRQVNLLSYSADAQLGRMASLAMDTADPPFPVHIVFESSLVEALRAMALEGTGVAWLPGQLIFDDLNHRRLVRAGPSLLEIPLRVEVFGEQSLVTGRLENLWKQAKSIAETQQENHTSA